MSGGLLTLVHGSASQRIVCPHLGEPVPTSDVTVAIQSSAGTELLPATAAEKGALATVLAAAAATSDRSITVGDTSGVDIGDPLVLTDTYGRDELTWCDGVDPTSDVILIHPPLARPFGVADVVTSALIYYDADISDADDYPVGLYYVAIFECADWNRPRIVVFHVARYPEDCPITYEHVQRVLSSVGFLRDSYDEPDLASPRSVAWDMLEADLLGLGRDPRTIRDLERVARVGGFLAAALFLLDRGGEGLAGRLAGDPVGSGGTYRLQLERVLAVPQWVDRDQDLIRDPGEMRAQRGRTFGRSW